MTDRAEPASYDASARDDDEPSPTDALPPLRVRAGGELGRGGMGVVRAAFDPVLERTVALKTPLNAVDEARLLHEARLTARLDHPAIVTVLDVGCDEAGRLSAVLPVRQGRSLGEAVAAGTSRAALLRAVHVAAQAVGHAHARGVVHRDLSPGNVRLGDDGAVWVLDWGLAATREEAAQPGFRGGTPGYTSPEQLAGEPSSPAADVWSLGALLHLVCTGAPPSRVRPADVPRPLWAIAQRALAPAPAQRYPDAQAFAAELTRWLDGLPVMAFVESPVDRLARVVRRSPRGALAAGGALVAVLAVVLVAGALVLRAQGEEERATAQMLLSSAERALHEDDVVRARALATEALRRASSVRAKGVLAATARIQPVSVTPVPGGGGCEVLDQLDAVRVCRVLAARERAVVLADHRVVELGSSPPELRLRAGDAVVHVHPLPGGTPQLRVSRDRTLATLSVPDQVVLISDGVRAATPCTPGQAVRAAIPGTTRVDVLCADDELVSLSRDAEVLSRTQVLGLGTLLRGAVSAALIDDDTWVFASADGRVAVASRSQARITRVTPAGLGALFDAHVSADGATVLLEGERGVGAWRVAEGHLLPTTFQALDGVRVEGSGFVVRQGQQQWQLDAKETLSVATNLHGRAALAVHDATRRVAVGDAMGTVDVLSLDTGALSRLEGPARVIKSLAFSPSGRWLALGAAGAEGVMVFDTRASPPRRVSGAWEGRPELRGRHVLWLDDERLVVSSWGPGPWVARFDEPTQRFVELPSPGLPADVRGVVTDGRQLWSLDVHGVVSHLDARGDVSAFAKWTPVPTSFAASPGGGAWVTAHGATVTRVQGGTSFESVAPVESLALARDGALAVCRRDGVVEVRSARDELLMEVPAHDGRCARVAWCDDERALCSVGWDGRLRVSSVR